MKHKNKILMWQDYKKLRDKLKTFNNKQEIDKSTYLKTYDELLALRSQGFPLLLQEGDAFVFDTPPVNAYLLPPLKKDQQTPRWLLVFFVTKDEKSFVPKDEKSWVQLLTWHTDNDASRVEALAGQARQHIENCAHRLDQRPIDLQFVPTGSTSTINLIFPQGELTIVASDSRGIIVTAWEDNVKTDPWIERYSYGDMSPAIRISRYDKTKNILWQDDVVEDIDGTTLGNGVDMGRIRGADGVLNNPDKNWVYLASNRGFIYRLDKDNPINPPLQSCTLFDEVLDVQMLPWPEKDFVLLATVRNSALVYILQDHGDAISILCWQYTGKHIWRLIGRGDEHILTLDERQTLLPLRLNTTSELSNTALGELNLIQNRATKFLVHTAYPAELRDFFLKPSNNLANSPEQFLCLGHLALEFFLQEIEHPHEWKEFGVWCVWLNEAYATIKPDQQKTLMILHTQLIKRVFRWLQARCYTRDISVKPINISSIGPALEVLLELLTLKPYAPDSLWILLFRKHDWLRLCSEKLGLLKEDKYRRRISQFEAEISRRRLDFAYGLSRLRPLNTLSSHRLMSQVTHIDDTADGHVFLIQSKRLLRHFKITPDGQVSDVCLLVEHDKFWHGQVQFVRTLTAKPQQAKRLLIGTSRGELVVLKWEGLSHSIVTVENRISCDFAVMSCLRLDTVDGYLLLGGRDSKGRACLYGLPGSGDTSKLQLLWTGDKAGILSVLRADKDEQRLWAINRDNGQLLSWDLNTLIKKVRNPRLILKPVIWLKTVQKLHALRYSEAHELLVCGGDGGLAFAIDARSGALRWLVNCVGNLRHIAYIPAQDKTNDVWLLCTDEPSSLMVNYEGCVTGVFENGGPVSALKVLGEHLLLATMDGRLLMMGIISRPTMTNFHPPAGGSHWGAYPVRSGGGGAFTDTDVCAVLGFEATADTSESLIKLMAFRIVVDYLKNNEVTPVFTKAFMAFWGFQNLPKKVVFLYWLHGLWLCNPSKPLHQTVFDFSVDLSAQCWKEAISGVNRESNDEANLLCKLVSPLLDILDQLIAHDKSHQPLSSLRETIIQALWQSNSTSINPHEPIVFSTIRLNKVIKLWGQLDHGHNDAQRLFAWCNAVAESAAISDIEPLQLLLRQLFQSHLRLLPIANPWQTWLMALVIDTATDFPAPKPLNTLDSGQLLLSVGDWETLNGLFGDNAGWQGWLGNLQTALTAVRHNHEHKPHKAWAERNAWRRLREHILVVGAERFTVAGQQALLALWWQHLENTWSDFIDLKLRELEHRVRLEPGTYLTLEPQDQWRDANHLELELVLGNYFPAHLNLLGVYWQNHKLDIQGLPKVLPADDSTTMLNLVLASDTANQLAGVLKLEFSDVELGQTATVDYPINLERNLTRFSSDPQWEQTWRRLEDLLVAYTERAEPFFWLDGDLWGDEERHFIKMEVYHNYNVPVSEHLWDASAYGRTATTLPVFSPDLALSAPAYVQLEQLHALLLPALGLQEKAYWALALWHQYHVLPASIAQALQSVLPDPELLAHFLVNLLGTKHHVHAVMAVLSELPGHAVGAWCANEPFYALKPEEMALDDVVYFSAARLLTPDVWALLDKHSVDDTDLAKFLDMPVQAVSRQSQLRQSFKAVADDLFTIAHIKPTQLEALARELLIRLGSGTVSYTTHAWCLTVDTPDGRPIFLFWQAFERIYLLPKITAVARAALALLPPGLWLCLGEAYAPSDLQGMAIALNEQQALALLHTENPSEALQCLNRIAGIQHSINPALAFRAAFGLANLIDTQFLYREYEIQVLWTCLKTADNSPHSGSAALIVGGAAYGQNLFA